MDQALRASIAQERSRGVLRGLTLACVLVIFALVILGGVVRVTDSGLGCPDWPFCHGKVIPSTDSATLIEYSHRLLAAVAGLLVLATTFVIWKWYRWELWLKPLVTIAFFLLIAQVVLGGITVRKELDEGLVIAHLAVAQAFLAMMILLLVAAWRDTLPALRGTLDYSGRRPLFILIAVVATYALILTGAYVQASGATGACGDSWPLCRGELFPAGKLAGAHMAHRVISLVAGAAIMVALVESWRLGRRLSYLKPSALVVGGLFLLQMIIGGVNVLLSFHQATNVLHLSLATALWAALVLLAALVYLAPGASLRGVGR